MFMEEKGLSEIISKLFFKLASCPSEVSTHQFTCKKIACVQKKFNAQRNLYKGI